MVRILKLVFALLTIFVHILHFNFNENRKLLKRFICINYDKLNEVNNLRVIISK